MYLFNFLGPELLVLLFIGLLFVPWIWAIVDIVRSEFKGSNDKVVFLLLVILLPLIGVLVYLFYGLKQKVPCPGY